MKITDALNAVVSDTVDKRGMKITGLAKVSGVSYNSLQNYLSRGRAMPWPFAEKVANGLGMSLSELVDLAEDYRDRHSGPGGDDASGLSA